MAEDTVRNILDAAERLFAENGFHKTSLRAITTEADVNLAAVNYHFGSKEALIQAVFARFLDDYTDLLNEKLNQDLAEDGKVAAESFAKLVINTALDIKPRTRNDLSVLMRLVGVAFTERQEHLRFFLSERYGRVYNRVVKILYQSHPELTTTDLFWRVQFMLGSLAFTFSSLSSLQELEKATLGTRSSLQGILSESIPFLVGGFMANPSSS